MVTKNKGGRPRKPRPIRHMVNFRVDEETLDQITAAAERAGLPLSAWVRRAMEHELGRGLGQGSDQGE